MGFDVFPILLISMQNISILNGLPQNIDSQEFFLDEHITTSTQLSDIDVNTHKLSLYSAWSLSNHWKDSETNH